MMNTFDMKLSDLKRQIEKHIQHTYLEKYIEKPFIDDDKLFMLSSIIQNTTYSEYKKRNYIITTMLVQIALDTHDLVTENHQKNESDQTKKNRQLTVLAGDYYSGLYYSLLAKIDDIPMIHTLASAIKEVNELKMNIFYKEYNSVHEFMEAIKRLESTLIIRVAEFVQQSSANELVERWLFIRKLVHEKESYVTNAGSQLFELLTNGPALNVNENQVVHVVEEVIQKQIHAVEETSFRLPSKFQPIKTYVNQKWKNIFDKNTIVMEEG